MLKPLLIAMLIYSISVIAYTIYFSLVGLSGAGAMTHRVLLALFYGALRWALIPTAPYLVYEFVVRR